MKLPRIVNFLVVATLLQASLSHAQVRPDDRGDRGDKGGSPTRDSEPPDRYEPPARDTWEPVRPDPRPDRDDDYNPWQPNPNPVRPDPRPDRPGRDYWEDDDSGSWGGGSSGGGYTPPCYGTGGINAESGDSYPPVASKPCTSTPDEPASEVSRATVEFRDVTRKTNGEWLRVNFKKHIQVARFDIKAEGYSVKIHEAYAYSENGVRIALKDLLTGTKVSNSKTTSEFGSEKIAYIDVRVESMGGLATVKAVVSSDSEKPNVVAVKP